MLSTSLLSADYGSALADPACVWHTVAAAGLHPERPDPSAARRASALSELMAVFTVSRQYAACRD